MRGVSGKYMSTESAASELAVYGLSGAQLSATPWTVALQASLTMEFSRQEY